MPDLPRNARGGYKITGLGEAAIDISPEKRAKIYGASTQCPPDACLHRLTDAHWHPRLRKKTRPC